MFGAIAAAACVLSFGLHSGFSVSVQMPKRCVAVRDSFIQLANGQWWCKKCGGKPFSSGDNLARHLDTDVHIDNELKIRNNEAECHIPPIVRPRVLESSDSEDDIREDAEARHCSSPSLHVPPPSPSRISPACDSHAEDGDPVESPSVLRKPPDDLVRAVEASTGIPFGAIPEEDHQPENPAINASDEHAKSFTDFDWGYEVLVCPPYVQGIETSSPTYYP